MFFIDSITVIGGENAKYTDLVTYYYNIGAVIEEDFFIKAYIYLRVKANTEIPT